MRKSRRLLLTLTLLLLAAALTLSGCRSAEAELSNIQPTSDKFRTYYQIFPYSFADSNSDGIGDIQGIIDKLDYIEGLHYDGLWLTPVHKSPSYHKYDVTDYCSIDPEFGTMEDYDRLVSECHRRGMTILVDLVYNHTALDNPWFEKCAHARMRGNTDDPYYNYYNFEEIRSENDIKGGWSRYQNTNWAYECQFYSGMPDLNLQNVIDEPEGYLAAELAEIMRFWLVDHDVDGFRLDAVTFYFSGMQEENLAFLTWLNDTAKAFKSDCYIVGEGSWENPSENQRYQESGIDSFFAFQHGKNANGTLSYAVRMEKAAYLGLIDQNDVEIAGPGIPAVFIANHDTARAYGISMAAIDPDNLKEMYGLLAMSYGATFGYYGDEVGMSVVAAGNSEKSYIDEDRRQPMPWGDSYQCKPVAHSTNAADGEKYPLGTVADQLKDDGSLLKYVARANAIRRSFPQIARYPAQTVYVNDYRDLCVVSKGEGQEKIYIVWNASSTASRTFNTSELGKVTLAATLSTGEAPKYSGETLTIPAKSFAILIVE